ncbi:SDR family oxidoreductase [Clostridium sp.]|uniref:SDR family oxidoreductase n=1 Tax=Clostridium sp. TaxID=1506 RepID=UPI00359FA533
MKKVYGKVVLVVGASSGIGKAIAETLAMDGYKVYGTSRKYQDDLKTIPETNSDKGFIKMLCLDVCSEESINKAVVDVEQKEGKVDILVNCAGFGIAGSVEDTSDEEAFRQFNTNFFGAHRICRSVIPIMRKQGHGLIINISSVAGLITVPFQSFYSASKCAMEALMEGLRMELKPFGIKVVLIEPGDTQTGFTNNRVFVRASEDSIYKEVFNRSIARMVKYEQTGPSPEGIVRMVQKILSSSNPPVRQVVGSMNKIMVFLKWFLPDHIVEYIVIKLYA